MIPILILAGLFIAAVCTADEGPIGLHGGIVYQRMETWRQLLALAPVVALVCLFTILLVDTRKARTK
jgi:hypothetical protein